jgi:hypothetical protein
LKNGEPLRPAPNPAPACDAPPNPPCLCAKQSGVASTATATVKTRLGFAAIAPAFRFYAFLVRDRHEPSAPVTPFLENAGTINRPNQPKNEEALAQIAAELYIVKASLAPRFWLQARPRSRKSHWQIDVHGSGYVQISNCVTKVLIRHDIDSGVTSGS